MYSQIGRKTIIATILGMSGLFAGAANAVILNVDTPVAGQHTIVMDPMTFTITANGAVGLIVFEDFFAADNADCGIHVGASLTASINGGAAFAIGANTCTGTWNGTFGILDANDLFINVATGDEFAVVIGDIVTISGTNTFSDASLPAFNPNYDGSAQLAAEFVGGAGTALSDVAVVPEPASLALLGLGLAGLGFSRRRKA